MCANTGWFSVRHIEIEGAPYLDRWTLWRSRRLGWALFLHRFHSGDRERWLHDHPWRWAISLIVWGGYGEERLNRRDIGELARHLGEKGRALRFVRSMRFGALRNYRWLAAPAINVLREQDFHRVTSVAPRPTWTLFLHGPRVRSWGFLAEDVGSMRLRWVDHRDLVD